MASRAMLDLVADLKGDAEDKLGGITGALGKLGLAGMGLGVLKGGFDAVVGGIGGFIDEAKDAERGASQLESVLKSTGGAAGLSKQQLLDMSSALSASGGLSQAADDAVLAGENMLLTFTNIKGPQFEGATQAILDMATAMNNGAAPSADQMKAQAIQLGKALNDPIKGLAALSKVGVAFTNDQKATIKEMINGKAASEALRDAGFELADETYKEIDANQKKYGTQEALRMSGLELDASQQQVFDTMTKGGDIAGAQTLIMAELNKEFGGAAAASAQTYEGHMATLNERMNDVKEGIGKALLPAITSITDLIAGPGMDALMQLANVLQEYLPGAIAAAQAVLMPLLTGLIEAFQTSIPVAIGILKTAIDVLGATWQTLEPIISPIIDLITQNLQPILIGIATALLTVVVPAFITWATAAGAAAGATITALLPVVAPIAAIAAAVALLAAAWENDWGGIRTTITDWWNTTGEPIFTQLKDWLGVQLTAALTTLSDFWTGTLQPALAQVWQFLTDSVFPALGTLLGWLADSIPPALQTLADFWNTILLPALSAVWSFIQGNVIPILKDVLTWIKDNLPPALKGLADLWNNTLQPALKTVWSFIQDNLIPILKDVLTWIKDNIPPAITALADLWNNTLKPALQAIWDFITLNLLPVFKSLVELGITVAHKALEALAGLWEKVISPALNALWTFIDTNLTPVLKTLVSDGLDKAHAAMDALAVVWNTVLGPALKVASDFIGGALKGALDGIGTALNNVKVLFDALASAINNLTLPDWLTPGSPTPLEYGLLGIQDALRGINSGDLNQFGADLAGVAKAGAEAKPDEAAKLFTASVEAVKATFDPTNNEGIAFIFMKGWTDLQNWFRYTWSVKFLGVLNLTLTDIRLAIQGQAAGFNQAGHMLGDAVIQGMVAALNAGAASVAAAVPLGAGAGAGGGKATPYVPPTGTPPPSYRAPNQIGQSAGSMSMGAATFNIFINGLQVPADSVRVEVGTLDLARQRGRV